MTSGSYKRTKEHNKKIGISNKGKVRTEEQRKNTSIMTKKSMKEKNCGERISKILKEKYKNGFINPMKGKKRPDFSKWNSLNPKLGEKNGQWIDGRSKLPYGKEFTKRLKVQIRKRDNYQCQICNKQFIEKKDNNKIFLTIHHIDFNKNNNDISNLICLCNVCNTNCNFKRNYWKWQLKIFMNLFYNTNHIIKWRYNE